FGLIGLAQGRMPDLVLIPAQILIGASLGVQFRREFLTRLVTLMIASSVVVVVGATVMALIAAGVGLALALPVPTLLLAFARPAPPRGRSSAAAGAAEMARPAKFRGLDGTMVAGFPLVRSTVILLLAPPASRLLPKPAKWRARRDRGVRPLPRGEGGGVGGRVT